MSKEIKCHRLLCSNRGMPEDMENNASNLLLCDDCYTQLRYLMADYLGVSLQEINVRVNI